MSNYIAGPYSAVWNSLALGQYDNEAGVKVRTQWFGEEVRGSNYGETVLDIISQGGDCFVDLTVIEANAAALATIRNPLGTAYQVPLAGTPLVAAGKAKTLVLTALGGSALGGAGSGGDTGGTPATITILATMLAPNFPVEDTFNTKLRKIPLRLRAFATLVSQTLLWASVT